MRELFQAALPYLPVTLLTIAVLINMAVFTALRRRQAEQITEFNEMMEQQSREHRQRMIAIEGERLDWLAKAQGWDQSRDVGSLPTGVRLN